MDFAGFFLSLNRYALPLLGLMIMAACMVWLWRLRPQTPPEAFLLNTINHDRLPLERFENSVGRSKNCDVVLGYASVSRFHAVIARRKHDWVIIDTGSHGGTRIDGLPVEKRTVLHHGQSIAFGSFEFLFCEGEEDEG